MQYKDFEIKRYLHSSIEIAGSGLHIYFDPWNNNKSSRFLQSEKADYIFVSHEHYDHCDPEAVKQLYKEGTEIYTNKLAAKNLEEFGPIEVKFGDSFATDDLKISVIRAYNIDKFRTEDEEYHPKKNSGLSFLIRIADTAFLFIGDSDNIPEFKKLEEEAIDVVFIPVGGTYTMDPKEAAEAVSKIKPKMAIPIHYGDIIGSVDDAELFKSLAGCEVAII